MGVAELISFHQQWTPIRIHTCTNHRTPYWNCNSFSCVSQCL